MYEVRLGYEKFVKVYTVKEAFKIAIDYFKNGWECDVTSELTGEIILSLRDHTPPYISEDVVYALR